MGVGLFRVIWRPAPRLRKINYAMWDQTKGQTHGHNRFIILVQLFSSYLFLLVIYLCTVLQCLFQRTTQFGQTGRAIEPWVNISGEWESLIGSFPWEIGRRSDSEGWGNQLGLFGRPDSVNWGNRQNKTRRCVCRGREKQCSVCWGIDAVKFNPINESCLVQCTHIAHHAFQLHINLRCIDGAFV